jgi:hypothetical protein
MELLGGYRDSNWCMARCCPNTVRLGSRLAGIFPRLYERTGLILVEMAYYYRGWCLYWTCDWIIVWYLLARDIGYEGAEIVTYFRKHRGRKEGSMK